MILYIQNSHRSSSKWINEESAQTSLLTKEKKNKGYNNPKGKEKAKKLKMVNLQEYVFSEAIYL